MLNEESSSKVVLVVDDDLMSRTKIAMAVNKMGYHPIKASGGEEGLEQLRNSSIDAMLLDLLMPELDGFEVLDTIRQSPDIPNIPTIVISSLEDAESEERAISLGANRCLAKGFEFATLKKYLDELLTGEER